MVTTRKPSSQNELSFINEIKLSLNFFSSSYENFLLLGYFNLSTENPDFKSLLNSFDLESLISKFQHTLNHYHPLLALI